MSAAPQCFRAQWRSIGFSVHWVEAYFVPEDPSGAIAHLEIVTDGRAPLPVTETGYKSHFLPRAAVVAAGGPVAYALAWCEEVAQKPAWKAREAAALQPSLF